MTIGQIAGLITGVAAAAAIVYVKGTEAKT